MTKLDIALPISRRGFLLGGLGLTLAPTRARATSVGPAQLTHGPLLGSVTPTSATVWCRTSAPAVLVAEWSARGDFTDARASAPVLTDETADFTAHLALIGLPSDLIGPVAYRVRGDGALWTPVKTFHTAPAPHWPGPVRIAAFSDWARSDDFPALDVALDRGADLLLFGGDLDHSNPVKLPEMRAMHRRLRGPSCRLGSALTASLIDAPVQVPVYHQLDDHDTRGDDCDGMFRNIDQARQAFREYWPMATDAGVGLPLYQQVSWGSVVDVFIADTRTARSPKKQRDDDAKTMLGLEQKAVLKAWALASTATWKVIQSGVPWNPTSKDADAWRGYQTEARELLTFFAMHHVTGVLIVSGDMHTGGCLDDGTNAGRPEANCPRANRCGNTTGKLGTWSHGAARSGEGDGFVELWLTPDSATLTIVGDTGMERRAMHLDA